MPVFPACPKCRHRVPVARILQRRNPEYVCGRCGERLTIDRALTLPAFLVPIIGAILAFVFIDESKYWMIAATLALPLALLFALISARVRRKRRPASTSN